ncbi:MAG: hypothetical protein FWD86_02410, partial [Firmicutes bacterium]|nr:hypothetical protein [Bacillota bacterium]
SSFQSCQFEFEEISLDDGFLAFANRQKVAGLERGLEQALADEGFSGITATVNANINVEIDIVFVTLNLTNMVLTKPSLNINRTERIRSLSAELLNISTDKVLIIE